MLTFVIRANSSFAVIGMSAVVTVWEAFKYKHNDEVVPGVPLPAPCPFCGQTDSAIDWRGASYHVECGHCGA